MMSVTRKITAVLLLTAMLAAVSCGGESAQTDTTEADGSANSDSSSEVKEYTPPKIDYKGYEFKMLIPLQYQNQFESSEASGDVVNDAVFNANLAVESLYKIKFKNTAHGVLWADRTDFMNLVRNSVLADDDAYDVVFPTYYYGEQLALEGNFLDMKLLDGLNLDQKWWVSGFNDQAEYDGRLYGAVGDYGLTDLTAQMVLYYNKRLYAEYGFENIYDLVRSGKWTFDKLLTMINGLGKDLDGNDAIGIDDQLGYICNTNGIRSFTVSSGIKFVDFEKGGTPVITIASEKSLDMYERLYNLMYKTNDAKLFTGSAEDMLTAFMDGRVLFMTNNLKQSANMRSMDDDFGIIPMPKYDEKQAGYVTYTAGPSISCIPKTADDPERTAAVLDALNYYALKEVVPAYYEVALKSKYARDEDTVDMLDIIKENVYYDFGFIYGSLIDSIADQYGNSLMNGVESFSSDFASKKEAYETLLAELIDGLEALK